MENNKTLPQAQLRIFLGMSAGVGKTFAMLKAAHQKMAEGKRVLIGFVETHGRPETEALLEGLNTIPRKKISYRNSDFYEFDIEEILRQRPEYVIVDELPHSNLPGSRHKKRFQDVLEILEAGIHVYTALNVQHLESRKEVVERITGIQIHETVPDFILDRADQVELVDITPRDLLSRLNEGKIYLGDKAQRAAAHFFKENKLTALREIALRTTAERVDQELRQLSPMQDGSSREKLLVAISHSPSSEKLIRATRRLASGLDAGWIAVHVDTGLNLSDEDQIQLQKNIQLAREMNAEVLTVTDTNLSHSLEKLSREHKVTQIIVGRHNRTWLRRIWEGGPLLENLIENITGVDIHILRQEKNLKTPSWFKELRMLEPNAGWSQYWYSFCFIVVVCILGGLLTPLIGYRPVGFIFLLAVMTVGFFGSLGAVLLSATLSALTWNFLFIPPILTFAISQLDDSILCLSYFVVAIFSGLLTHRIRWNERMLREREEKTQVLYETLNDINTSTDAREALPGITNRLENILQGDCAVLLKNSKEVLETPLLWQDRSFFRIDEKEMAVAQWALQNQKNAGWSTDTLSQSQGLYIPLCGPSEALGVFIYKPARRYRRLSPDQLHLLQSVIKPLALALEKDAFREKSEESKRLRESEKLHQTLLNSISHELRTPLTVILNLALQLKEIGSKDASLDTISKNLQNASARLNRVIENLLDMSRLNSGMLSLNKDWQDIGDIFNFVFKRLTTEHETKRIDLKIADEARMAFVDFRLLEHAFANIILNSFQYAGPQCHVQINVSKVKSSTVIDIQDDGPGIPENERKLIFEKFYRIPGSPPGGTGLGLSLVQAIIELHGGQISCEDRFPRGARFVIELPVKNSPPAFEEKYD